MNSEFGDFDIEKLSPLGTAKSRIAGAHTQMGAQITLAHRRRVQLTIGGPCQVHVKVVFVPSGFPEVAP